MASYRLLSSSDDLVWRPLSKGTSSSGCGQATPEVAYQPKQQVAYMHPLSTSPNAYPDKRTHGPSPHYNEFPEHQGSKYIVQGHEYS